MKDIQKEITPIAADDLFIVLNHPNAKFDYPVHYHPDYEINLVMDTYGSRIVGDSVEAFEALDLIMRSSRRKPCDYHPVLGQATELSDIGKTLIQPHQTTAA